MRLLITADKLTGGAGNVAQQLASHYSQIEGNDVFLLIEANNKHRYDLSKVKIIDRKIVPEKLHNPIKIIKRYIANSKKLRDTINDCSADVIISFLNSISPEILLSQWSTKTPIIVSERSNPYFEWRKKDWPFRLKWRLSYRRANMIVYQFKSFEPFFKHAYKRKRTCVIPNMLFADAAATPSREKTRDTVRFATVATLYPVKRIGLMIDIVGNLLKKHYNVELNIYGDGPDRDSLERKVSELGIGNHVVFHGHVQDTIACLRDNDVLLLTSEREGFPNVVLEAMGAGIPSVMFDFHDGIKELVTEGVTGFLIKQDNTSAFVEKLEYLVQNPQLIDEMGKNAYSEKQRYDKETVMRLWTSCVEKVVAGK